MDSSGYLALISTRDAHHLTATEAINLIAREQRRTFTSAYVIAEAHALFLTRLGHGGKNVAHDTLKPEWSPAGVGDERSRSIANAAVPRQLWEAVRQ